MVESTHKTQAKTYFKAAYMHSNDHGSDSCGYCDGSKGTKGHKSWGITCSKMTVADYEKLMWRGWRRCGTYYYKWDFE